jgi:hypothetical protein
LRYNEAISIIQNQAPQRILKKISDLETEIEKYGIESGHGQRALKRIDGWKKFKLHSKRVGKM